MADKTVVVRFVARVGELTGGIRTVTAETARAGNEIAGSASKAAKSVHTLGLASAAAGKLVLLGIGGAMAVSAQAAIQYESSLLGVAKTTDLAGDAFNRQTSPLARFGDAIRGLSLRIPVNVNELNRIAELGGQLGIQIPNLVSFTDTVAKLGVTTNLSTEEAATGLARLANVLQIPQDRIKNLGSGLVELGNNFATTESEILTFSLRIAPVAATIGMSEAGVLALSAALSALGIPAERGGTAIQRFFIKVADAVESGGDKLENFARVAGMASDEFATLFQRSPQEAFVAFVRGLDDINKSGGNVFRTLRDLNLEEQRTVATLLATASGWEVVADAVEKADSSVRDNIALDKEAGRRFESNASQLQLLANSFNDLRIEAGAAIIGSGGLTAVIDVLREFLSIMKENIDVVGGFSKVLGVLAAISIGRSIGKIALSASQATMSLVNLRTSLVSGAGAANLMKAANQTLAFSINAVGAAATLLVGVWAWQAIKAAELRAEVRQLNDAIAAGADPLEEYIKSLRERGILDEEAAAVLAHYGISQREFANHVISGGNALEFLSERTGISLAKLGLHESALQRVSSVDLVPLTDRMDHLGRLSVLATEEADALFSLKRSELVDALIDANFNAGFTTDRLREIADMAIRTFGLDITGSDIVRFMSGEMKLDALDRIFGNTGPVDAATESVGTWMDAIFKSAETTEDAEKIIDDFFTNVGEAATEFQTTIADAFIAISNSVRAGFPAWDEYTQVVSVNISDVIAAQERYLEDLRAWADAQPTLVAHATQATMDWFDALDPAMKGALGRLRATSEEEFIKLIQETNANFAEAGREGQEIFVARQPGIARAAMRSLALSIAAEAVIVKEQQNLNGQEFHEAVVDGFQRAAAENGITVDDLLASLTLTELLALGFEAGELFTSGFLRGLADLGVGMAQIIRIADEGVKSQIRSDWVMRSPSRVMEAFGRDLVKGWSIGVEASQPPTVPAPFIPTVASAAASQVTTSNMFANSVARSSEVSLTQIFERVEGENIAADIQRGTLLAGLSRYVETR